MNEFVPYAYVGFALLACFMLPQKAVGKAAAVCAVVAVAGMLVSARLDHAAESYFAAYFLLTLIQVAARIAATRPGARLPLFCLGFGALFGGLILALDPGMTGWMAARLGLPAAAAAAAIGAFWRNGRNPAIPALFLLDGLEGIAIIAHYSAGYPSLAWVLGASYGACWVPWAAIAGLGVLGRLFPDLGIDRALDFDPAPVEDGRGREAEAR